MQRLTHGPTLAMRMIGKHECKLDIFALRVVAVCHRNLKVFSVDTCKHTQFPGNMHLFDPEPSGTSHQNEPAKGRCTKLDTEQIRTFKPAQNMIFIETGSTESSLAAL